jgi:putative peptidoglycan lipid II flippase
VVLALLRGLNLHLGRGLESVREVVRNFFPVFFSRGVVQTSAYIDNWIASFLPTGAVASLGYAQVLYTLPISLFGMSISAAELPEMSSATGHEHEIAEKLRVRLGRALRQIAFLVVPSVMAFLALGNVVVAALLQAGRFSRGDTYYVWGILAGSTVGLLSSSMGRLYSSTYYALRDTRTPMRYAVVRVVLTTILGYIAALPLPHLLGYDPRWGAAGLTATAGFSGWVEFLLLRRTLHARIGRLPGHVAYFAQLWTAATLAALAALGVEWMVGSARPIIDAIAILGVYGLAYFGVAALLKVPEIAVLRRVVSRKP